MINTLRKSGAQPIPGIDEVNFLMNNPSVADYYDQICKHVAPKPAYNWVSIELQSLFNRAQVEFNSSALPCKILLEVIQCVEHDIISMKSAKQVLQAYYEHPESIEDIVNQLGLRQSNDTSTIEAIADKIITENPKQVTDYKAGKTKLLGFFVGQIMKQSKGQVNPKQVNEIVLKKLS